MLRTTPIVFCGLLSIPILKQRLKWFQWTGIMMIVIGIVIKSIPSVIEMFSDEPEDLVWYLLFITEKKQDKKSL